MVLLVPWKSRVVRGGLRRARPSRWASLLLAALALVTLIAGLGYATGLLRSIVGMPGLWVHIAVALTLVPLVVWHVWARRIRPRRTDLSRRALLRAGVLAVGAVGLYAATEAAVSVLGLPGARRRFTGSYETASFRPEAMPSTSWLLDAVPGIDPDRWRLVIEDGQGRRELTLAELSNFDTQVRATLDCTSGWYSRQDWAGLPLGTLLHRGPGAQSVYVHSVTGYWVRFPIHELDRLLLATQVGGASLSADHGFPLRLVAPERRGYWWVKWVDRIEVQSTPSWWQPPFPRRLTLARQQASGSRLPSTPGFISTRCGNRSGESGSSAVGQPDGCRTLIDHAPSWSRSRPRRCASPYDGWPAVITGAGCRRRRQPRHR